MTATGYALGALWAALCALAVHRPDRAAQRTVVAGQHR